MEEDNYIIDSNGLIYMELENDKSRTCVKNFSCKDCGKKFTADRNMKRHIYTVHEGHKDYKCKHCNQYFGLKQVMERHIENAHNNQTEVIVKLDPKIKIKIKNHKCEVCGKSFTQVANLKKHIDDVHLKIKDYLCKYCDDAFNQHKKLMDHLLGYHKISKLRLGLE